MSDKELSDAEYEALISGTCDNAAPAQEHINASVSEDSQNDARNTEAEQPEPQETVASTRSSYSELRKLQREMFRLAHSDPMGSARASAARVWRDLEILRMAKLGKPLCLTTTGKPEPKQASSPLLSLTPADQQQAA